MTSVALFERIAPARRVLMVFALAVLAGCATQGGDAVDPLEPMNRAVYQFNDGFDRAIAKPVGSAYRDAVPGPVRDRVWNFFANIGDIFIGANNLLQGKFAEGASDWARVLWNTTFGLLGIHDVATEFGLEKHNEDFGQTFGRWGVAEGAYLVLPILGSSSVRDAFGTVLDMKTDPLGHARPVADRNVMVLLRATGQRADLLDASRILEEAALDKYAFQRDAYLQRRRSLIRDGIPAAPAAPRAGTETSESQSALALGDVPNTGVPANVDAVTVSAGGPL